jgi:hypothetical protein
MTVPQPEQQEYQYTCLSCSIAFGSADEQRGFSVLPEIFFGIDKKIMKASIIALITIGIT